MESSLNAAPILARWRRRARRCSTLEDTATYRLEVQLDEARATLIATVRRSSIHGWTPRRRRRLDRRRTSRKSRGVDPASHSFLVKMICRRRRPSTPGSSAGPDSRAPARRALTVPASALVSRGQLTFVYSSMPTARARLRPVSPGAAIATRVEVLAGLRERRYGRRPHPPPSLTDGARVPEWRP